MKKLYALVIMAGIFLSVALFFTAMPFIFLGHPLPFFSIYNKDVYDHETVIEILDSDNESVFKKAYELAPQELISEPKPSWLLLRLSFPPGDKEKYTVKVTSDSNMTKSLRVELQLWNNAHIELYGDDAESPITIGIDTI